MLTKIRAGLHQRRVQVFLFFLFCSLLIWFLNELSETYESTVSVELEYIDQPDSLLLVNHPPDKINVRLRTTGFQLLRMKILPKQVPIHLSRAVLNGKNYEFTTNILRNEIQDQLTGNTELIGIGRGQISLNFEKVLSKEVPIIPNMDWTLAPNYLLMGSVELEPSTVTLFGPASVLDTITKIATVPLNYQDLSADLSEVVMLEKPRDPEQLRMDFNTVRLSAQIARFTEKEFLVAVRVVNLPNNVEIKTFPARVTLLCKGSVEAIKNLENRDFRVIADFANSDPGNQMLKLEVGELPDGIFEALLKENQVEYILRRL